MSLIVAICLYAALAIFTAGVVIRVIKYLRTPSVFVIPIHPAPTTVIGVALRVMREVFLFASLFRANKWTWLLGCLFHVGLAAVLCRHLFFVTDPVWGWVLWLLPWGDLGAWVMVAALAGLWLRRLLVGRVRYISAPSDHLMLGLLLVIGASGLLLRHYAWVDLAAVRQFMLGLQVLEFGLLPRSWILFVHVLSAAGLIAVFPFSKLMHFVAPVFSPAHVQVNAPRRNRGNG